MTLVSRRTLLRAGLLALGGPAAARAAGGMRALTVAHIRHGGAWNARPTGLRRLLWEVGKRTSVEVAPDAVTLELSDPQLFYNPMAYCASDGGFPPWSADQRSRLARYLTFGGMVVLDSVDGLPDGGAAASFRRELEALFQDARLKVLSREHVIYRSFYLLDRAEGRTVASPDLWALELEGRVAAVMTLNDLAGAWAADNFGLYLHDVVPGGDAQRERAFRLGVNLMMYATCLDYKSDQVHIPFILKKRRR